MKEPEYVTLSNKVKLDMALKILNDVMVYDDDRDNLAKVFNILDALRANEANRIQVDVEL